MKTLGDLETRREIAARMGNLRADSPARWGCMNAHQAICHLNDSFKAVLGKKPVSEATGFVQQTLLKWAALWLPLEWPRGFRTRPEIDQQTGGTPPLDFDRDLEELRTLAARFTEAALARAGIMRHPVFGAMTAREWLRWGYLHVDHHLRQFGA